MSTLCYPYGGGITCVCEEGRIYKCFPDLQSHTDDPRGDPDQQAPQLHTDNLNGLDRRSAASFKWLIINIEISDIIFIEKFNFKIDRK